MNGTKCDLHIHTHYLGCANQTMVIADIVRECERVGVQRLGITDHLNSLDRLPPHRQIKKDILNIDSDVEIFFGVELNFQSCDGEFAFSADIKEDLGFQFAIGGIHATYLDEYDLSKIVDVQHRHHLKTCRDPLCDVLVHPYWFGKGEFDRKQWPWFDSMKAVPEAYARELGQVAAGTGTAVEINACANVANSGYSQQYVQEYVEFLRTVAEEGACFSMGSDAHDIGSLAAIRQAWDVFKLLGLPPERAWAPTGRPIAGAGSDQA